MRVGRPDAASPKCASAHQIPFEKVARWSTRAIAARDGRQLRTFTILTSECHRDPVRGAQHAGRPVIRMGDDRHRDQEGSTLILAVA